MAPFDLKRAVKSLSVLANDLERQLSGTFDVICNFEGNGPPFVLRRQADGSERVIDIQSPVAPGIPVFGTSDPTRLLVDDLRIRRHLGDEVERIRNALCFQRWRAISSSSWGKECQRADCAVRNHHGEKRPGELAGFLRCDSRRRSCADRDIASATVNNLDGLLVIGRVVGDGPFGERSRQVSATESGRILLRTLCVCPAHDGVWPVI